MKKNKNKKNKYINCIWCGIKQPETPLSAYCGNKCRYEATGKKTMTKIYLKKSKTTEDKYTQKYIKAIIEVCSEWDEKFIQLDNKQKENMADIINAIYEDGFEDGADIAERESAEGSCIS